MLDDLYKKIVPKSKADKPTGSKKKYEKKGSKTQIPCAHCGELYDFPSFYCSCCEQHCHVIFRSHDNADVCGSCHSGQSRQGQAKLRLERRWFGHKFNTAALDQPEWHDMLRESEAAEIGLVWHRSDQVGN